MKKVTSFMPVYLCFCLGAVFLFFQTNSLAEKAVDWQIEQCYQKEVQDLYNLVCEQLEAQNALDMIDMYMEMVLPPIQAKYYETRTAKKERLENISQVQMFTKILSAGLFLVGAGGLVWNIHKQKPDR